MYKNSKVDTAVHKHAEWASIKQAANNNPLTFV